jgi:hypothetical protein
VAGGIDGCYDDLLLDGDLEPGGAPGAGLGVGPELG